MVTVKATCEGGRGQVPARCPQRPGLQSGSKTGLSPRLAKKVWHPPGPVPEDQLASLTSPRRKPSEEKGEQEEGSSPTLPRDSRFPGTQPSPDEPAGLLGHW